MKKRLITYLSKEEFNKLNNQINNHRDRLILNTLYETGCTVNELINIKISDLNFLEGTIKFLPEKHSIGYQKLILPD